MASINVKVIIKNQTKTFRFSNELYIGEAIKEILVKLNETSSALDHGLFQPATDEIKARWLKNNRTFKYYGIASGTELEFKKKHRILKIKLMDESTKTVLIDSTKNIKKIIGVIGAKLNLKNPEEYSLKKLDSRDDEWLDDDKTLHELDIKDDEVLLFAKRFFSADYNVDKDDPVQLHLIYVQSSNNVVNGKYDPIQRDEVIYLAANHCQILFGNYDANRHKAGFLDLSKIVPPAWRKDKKLEKDILREFKKLTGESEINAKYKYVQLVRSLKTYGITYYECSMKVKGKKKPIKVFLGITKDGITLLDDSREVKKQWNIDQVRRWTSTATVFTLDFGDFEEEEFVFHTNDADAIAKLIGGYIDIIMKAQQDASRVDEIDNAEEATISDTTSTVGSIYYSYSQSITPGSNPSNIHPHQMNISHISPSLSHYGSQPMGYSIESMQPMSVSTSTSAYPNAQKMLVFDVGSAMNATNVLCGEMERGLEGYQASTNLTSDQWRNQLNSYQEGLEKSIKDLLAQARMDPASYDRNTIDLISKKLNQDLLGLAVAAKNIASLEDDLPLLTSAKYVADSISKLLRSVEKNKDNPGDPNYMDELFSAEKSIKNTLLAFSHARNKNYTDRGAEALLKALLDKIRKNLDAMLETSKNAVYNLSDPSLQAQLLKAIEEKTLKKDWLLGSLEALFAVSVKPEIRNEVEATTNELTDLTLQLISDAQTIPYDPDSCKLLNDANNRLKDSLKTLLMAINAAELRGAEGEIDIDTPKTELLNALTLLRKHIDSPNELIVPTKNTVHSSNELMIATKKLADASDDTTYDRLISAAKNMSNTLQTLLDSVRVLYKNPNDMKAKNQTLDSTNRLEMYSQDIVADAGIKAALTNLRFYSKLTSANAVDLSTLSRENKEYIGDENMKNKVEEEIQNITKEVNDFVDIIRKAASDPLNHTNQFELLEAAKKIIPVYENYYDSLDRVQPYVNVSDDQKQLMKGKLEIARSNVKELEKICKVVSNAGGQTIIEEAMADLEAILIELDAAEYAASNGLLQIRHDQSREKSLEELSGVLRTVITSLEQMVNSAKDGKNLSHEIKQLSETIDNMAQVVIKMISTVTDRATQIRMLRAAKNVVLDTIALVGSSRTLSTDCKKDELLDIVQKDYKKVKESIASLITSGKGLDAGECDIAIGLIKAALAKLSSEVPTNLTFKQSSDNIRSVSKALTAAFAQLITSGRNNPQGIGSASKITASTVIQLLQAVSIAASASVEETTKDNIIRRGRELGENTIELLQACKAAAANRGAETMLSLNKAGESVSQSIQELLNSLGASGSQECEEAIRIIMNAISRLDNTNDAKAKSNEELLDVFMNDTNTLISLVGKIAAACRVSTTKLGSYSKGAALSVESLIEGARSSTKSSILDLKNTNNQIVQTILAAVKTLAVSGIQYIKASLALSQVDNDENSNEFSNSSKSFSDSISAFIQAYSVLNPAFNECSNLEAILHNADAEIDAHQIALSTISGSKQSAEKSYDLYQEDIVNLCKEIGEDVSNMLNAVRSANVKSLVSSARNAKSRANTIAPLSKDSSTAASTMDEKKKILSIFKELVASFMKFTRAAKEANPNDRKLMENVEISAEEISSVISKILGMLQSSIALQKDIDVLIEEVKKQEVSVSTPYDQNNKKYNEYREAAQKYLSKDFKDQLKKVISVTKDTIGDISVSAARIRESFPTFILNIRGAMFTTKEKQSSEDIMNSTKTMIANFIKFLERTKSLVVDPTNNVLYQNQKSAYPLVEDSLPPIFAALKKGALGEVLCEQAVELINRSIGKITTSSIFAQAGQLLPEKDAMNKTLMSLQQELTNLAHNTIIISQKLYDSISLGQEELGHKAIELSKNIQSLADVAVDTSSRMNDSNSQDALLGAAKMLAIRAVQYILNGKDLESSSDHSAQETFDSSKDSIQEAVSHLVNVIQSSTSDVTASEENLESSIKQIRSLMKNIEGYDNAKPEDVIKAARDCTVAVSSLVFASTQDEIVIASQRALSATENLLNSAKTASTLSPDPQVSKSLVDAAIQYAECMCQLLETSKLSKQDPTSQAKMEDASSDTTTAIQNVVKALQSLPNASDLTLDEVSELEKKAAIELELCAKAIDAATKTLNKSKSNDSNNDPIKDAILTAAMAIMQATGTLVQGATTAQKEREEKMKGPGGKKYKSDPTWANGLINASKAVTSAVNQLIKATDFTDGKIDQELLISSARALASSTAQLVTASRAKSDPNSPSQKKLIETAKLITSATTKLVDAAQRASEINEQDNSESFEIGDYIGMSKEKFEQQIKILKLEAEIERERRRMANMNKKSK